DWRFPWWIEWGGRNSHSARSARHGWQRTDPPRWPSTSACRISENCPEGGPVRIVRERLPLWPATYVFHHPCEYCRTRNWFPRTVRRTFVLTDYGRLHQR